MALQYQFRPLDQWPGERTKNRKRSSFRASYQDTLKLLEHELRLLGATNIVLQADCEPQMIRLDGMLRSDARLRSPCIILSFDSKHGPLSYPCDRYANWDCNVRAIALSLQALRAVDRYGVTRRAEQYKGWTALPGSSDPTMSVEEAANWIAIKGGGSASKIKADPTYCLTAIRAVELLTHPDRGGGSGEFKRTQQAREVLVKHHGGA